jgi:hypothetical protein
MKREGGCFCGAIRFEATGDAVTVAHCHCLHCRRTSGAAFVTWSEFPSDHFTFTKGSPSSFSSRPGVTRQFCGKCGSPLTWQRDDATSSIDVITCCFDDPSTFDPQTHIFVDRLLPWVHLDDGLPRHPRQRPRT